MAVTRAEAKAQGLRHYFTSKQCKHGHVCRRLTSNGACVECARAILRRGYHSDIEKSRAIQRASRLENPERSRAWQREWRKKNLEKMRAKDRARYAGNPEKRRAVVAAWRKNHRDYNREYSRDWQKANPDKVRVYTHTRRARKISAEGTFAKTDIDRIFAAQNGRCAIPWCREKLEGRKWQVDHIIALSKGGSNWPSNLQIVHKLCNQSKNARDPIDHARAHGMLL